MSAAPTFCAIDFGTSNSAVAVPGASGTATAEFDVPKSMAQKVGAALMEYYRPSGQS